MAEIALNYPKKLPKQDRSRATVEAIVEATARILGSEGRQRLSTNRIAEVAGVSVGSLYQYFPNKESLLAEVRRRYDQGFMDRMVSQLARFGTLPPREALREFMRFMIEIHAENPRLHNEIAAEIPDSERQYLQEFVLAYLEAHRAELRPPDLELAAYICLQVGEALTHGTALNSPELLGDERFLDEVCDLLYRYLAKPEDS